MYLSCIIVTKNSSIAVRTLHNLLNLNLACMQNNVQIELNFIHDNPFEKAKLIMKKIKTSDRLLFIEYGVSLDIESVKRCLMPLEQGYNCLVFPTVTRGINWDMFKKKVKADSKEPINQLGLNFDTQVSKKINGDNYIVTETNPKVWVVDSKSTLKKLKNNKKGEQLSLPAQMNEMFEKFKNKNVKIQAYVAANVIITYQHECFSNILESAGVHKD